MSTYKVLKKSDYRQVPWRNGLGLTSEIASEPMPADSTTWLWRLSQASVDKSSAFSLYPEHERTLVIIDGEGLRLQMHGGLRELRQREVLHFSGSETITCELLSGAVKDFNVFTKMGAVTARVVHHSIAGSSTLKLDGDRNFAFVVRGQLDSPLVATHETLSIERGALEVKGEATLLLIELTRLGG